MHGLWASCCTSCCVGCRLSGDKQVSPAAAQHNLLRSMGAGKLLMLRCAVTRCVRLPDGEIFKRVLHEPLDLKIEPWNEVSAEVRPLHHMWEQLPAALMQKTCCQCCRSMCAFASASHCACRTSADSAIMGCRRRTWWPGENLVDIRCYCLTIVYSSITARTHARRRCWHCLRLLTRDVKKRISVRDALVRPGPSHCCQVYLLCCTSETPTYTLCTITSPYPGTRP